MTAVDLTTLAHIEARAKMIGAQVQIVPGTSSLLFVSRHGVTETVTDAERLEELLREDQSEALFEGLQASAARTGHTLHRGRGDPPIYWLTDPQGTATWLTDIVDVQRAVALLPALPVLGLEISAALETPARDMNLSIRSVQAADAVIERASRP